jgi:hypothetical protein
LKKAYRLIGAESVVIGCLDPKPRAKNGHGSKRLDERLGWVTDLPSVLSIPKEPAMFCRTVTMAIVTLIILSTHATAALADRATYRLPCTISYKGKPPVTTDCLVDIDSSRGRVLETIRTRNGKVFVIQHDNSEGEVWYIDHTPATMISEEPSTCYQNVEVTLCL